MDCGFCESALSNCVETLLVDWVAKPVGRQLHYLCCFRHNVKQFREKKDELPTARARLQHEIQIVENQLQEIEGDVRRLQSDADDILKDAESMEKEIEKNKRCFGWCPNWWWRYRLGKNLAKEILVISELLEKIEKFCRPGRVGYSSTSTILTTEFLSSKEFMFSKSSNIALHQIVEALQDDKVSMIGLWGIGGSGKTTLAREVGHRAKEQLNLFDKVVFTTVSQNPNFHKIQDEIAKFLDFRMNTEQGQRRSEQELWVMLQKEKNILIILDDVWAEFNLKEKIGIPLGEDHKGCKVLLTTRRLQVCRSMECQNAVPLGCLDEQEAWALFEKKASLQNSDDAIKKVAGQIVQKCKGLPIAIVTIGSALKGNTNPDTWKATFRRLKNRRLPDIEDIGEKNAYICLEVSFDYLKEMETKKCFLLCSLFPEDHEIYVEDLVRYAWGLELYDGVRSFEEVRTEVLAAIDILKNSCLLLDSGEMHVKMHDVVRDVALWIASGRKKISFSIKSEVVETWPEDETFETYTAISFKTSQIDELPKGLICPNLKILLLLGHDRGVCSLIAPEAFQFQTNLRTLHLESYELLDISILGELTNLRTLHLENCTLPGMSILGKLKKLQALSFCWSDIIELPEEIGDLNNLKLLDLSNCESLQRIPPHLIRRLSNLEELYLHGCQLWADENTTPTESYASLSEVNSLPKLTVLSLEIALIHLPKDFVFRKLPWYDICIEEYITPKNIPYFLRKSFYKNSPIMRSLKIDASVIDACKQLFGDVESLNLKNLVGFQNLVPSFDQRGFNKLTSLGLESCEDMKCLIDTTKQHLQTTVFSALVKLSLTKLLELEELCSGHQPQWFLQKLKTLKIVDCKEMIGAIPILQFLEELEVRSCDKIQLLFQTAELGSSQQALTHHVSLTSLKVVQIDSCNKLTYLFPATVADSLGQLETLKIFNCLGLEEIIQETEVSNISLQSLREVRVDGCNNLTSLSSLCNGHILKNLKKLVIVDCCRLEYTFPTSMAEGLPQLKEIELENLPQLNGRNGNDVVLTLPSLQVLTVESCPQLTSFFISVKIQIAELGRALTHHVSLTSLKVVQIDSCNKLTYLFPATVADSLGQLEKLKIFNCLGLEEIIQETEVSNISLQSLREVRVDGCNNLTSLSSLCNGHILKNLKKLVIVDCCRLEYTFPTSMAEGLPQLKEIELENLPQLNGNDIVLTLSLQVLKVKSCPQLTPFIISAKIQTAELGSSQQALTHHVSLTSLKVVRLDSFNKLTYLFPATVADSLGQLETLEIFNCLGLEEIIQETEVSNISLQSLREVRVDGCNNLTSLSSLCNGHILKNLKKLVIVNCCRLEYTFPTSMAECLPQLKEIELENLPQLNGNDIVLTLSLQVLVVKSCPQLTPFIISANIQIAELGSSQQALTHHVSLTSLNVVYIDSCNKLTYLFPATVADSLGQLKTLWIFNCIGLEEIIQETEGSNISLQSLREVRVDGCNNLTSLSSLCHGHILENLKELVIANCCRLEYTFPTSMAEGLPQLKEIALKNLPQLNGRNGNDIVLTLPSLQVLTVKSCPQLTPFIISAKIQELVFEGMTETKQVGNMRGGPPNMEYLTITNFEEYLFDADGYNLSSLNELRLEGLPELRVVWKGPIEDVNFQNLSALDVYCCERLRYIFSPTTVLNLPQLSSLTISECDELEQIIEKDETSSQDHQPICFPNLTIIKIVNCANLKSLFPVSVVHCLPKLTELEVRGLSKLEKVFEIGDEANVSKDKEKVIQLPQLNCLRLAKLPNLKSFSPMTYHFVLPSLDGLIVESCPNITTSFSVDSNQCVHAITETIRPIDENIMEESSTTQETTWPIGSDIDHWRTGDVEIISPELSVENDEQ